MPENGAGYSQSNGNGVHQLQLPPLVMGGAGFSYQLHPKPEDLPVLPIVKRAFELGLRAIDTSPYYEPSEELLGAALSSVDIAEHYARSDYFLMTKCGRIKANHFEYSPSWIRKSVARSLQRFNTSYLDVVFCHDVEFVSVDQALEALGALFELKDEGVIRHVGISGYPLNHLVRVAEACLERYGRPVDVVQNWAQLSFQNTRLERYISSLKNLGIRGVYSASPLACGLLRAGGVPVGSLGDWHPAPAELRHAARRAADAVASQGDDLAGLALRYAIAAAMQLSSPGFMVSTITGVSHMSELTQNVSTASKILIPRPEVGAVQSTDVRNCLADLTRLDEVQLATDAPLCKIVRGILGEWVDYDFTTKTQLGKGENERAFVNGNSQGAPKSPPTGPAIGLPEAPVSSKNGWINDFVRAPLVCSLP